MNCRRLRKDARPHGPSQRSINHLIESRVVEPLEARTYFSPVVFARPVLYPTGTYPTGVVTADLTGNGKLDVITADFGTSSIAVLRGNGDGTLTAPAFFPVGNQPQALATGDFNGDGIPDVVVANSASNTISVLLGKGDGTFQPQAVYNTQVRPEAIAVSDLIGNGRLDVITANQGSNSVSVFMNNGDGTFAPALDYDAGFQPDALAVADLNGDERPDIVTVNPTNSNLHVLLNHGDGTFKMFGTYLTGDVARSVGIADMNSDGRPDIVTSNLHGTSVSLLLNNGDATFVAHQDFTSGAFPFSITLADINGDGRPDVITANNYDNSIGVLVHDVQGTFYPELVYHGGQAPTDVAVGDLNGDGRPDLIAVDYNTSDVAVVLNQTKFTPLIPTTTTLTPQINPVQKSSPLVLTARVTPSRAGKIAPVGVVQFFDGDAVLGIAHVNAAGIAHVRITLPSGNDVLSAHYAGDSIYAGSLSTTVVESAISPDVAVPFVVPSIPATHFPSVFVPGARGSLTLSITNQGAGRARGTVGVRLYASTDGLVDSTAIPLSTKPGSIGLNLIGGQTRALNVGFTFLAGTFAPGQYTILAVLTPGQGFTAAQVSATAVAAATAVRTALNFSTVGRQSHSTLTRTEGGRVVTYKLSGPGTGAPRHHAIGTAFIGGVRVGSVLIGWSESVKGVFKF